MSVVTMPSMRATTWSTVSWMRSNSMNCFTFCRIWLRARASGSSRRATSRTSNPFWAKVCAMPSPMVPVPTISIFCAFPVLMISLRPRLFLVLGPIPQEVGSDLVEIVPSGLQRNGIHLGQNVDAFIVLQGAFPRAHHELMSQAADGPA